MIQRWTPEEDQFILANLSMSRGELADRLKRPVAAVYKRIMLLREKGIMPAANRQKTKSRSEEGRREAQSSLDPYLIKMISFDLTERQWILIAANHKRVPRRELARMVGISKLRLNQALLSRGYETVSAEA